MTSETKEWATSNLNIATGCEHNCRYCYARHNAVIRFRRVSAEDWPKMKVNKLKVHKQYRKREGVIMFPSSHDITPLILDSYCIVLLKLLKAGNQVLIVTKPHLECIKEICDICQDYKEQILFRFTIGSEHSRILKFWEPNAPDFWERLSCLEYAFGSGYKTSVSCEPFLDLHTASLYQWCSQYLTDSFWVGKLNDFNQRVNIDAANWRDNDEFVNPLKVLQFDSYIKRMYDELNGLSYIRWKDSIMEVINDETTK